MEVTLIQHICSDGLVLGMLGRVFAPTVAHDFKSCVFYKPRETVKCQKSVLLLTDILKLIIFWTEIYYSFYISK